MGKALQCAESPVPVSIAVQPKAMDEQGKNSGRSLRSIIVYHAAALLAILVLAIWLRRVPLPIHPVLHGYLQVTTGLLALVFVAVALVRFQGTQDRISLI